MLFEHATVHREADTARIVGRKKMVECGIQQRLIVATHRAFEKTWVQQKRKRILEL